MRSLLFFASLISVVGLVCATTSAESRHHFVKRTPPESKTAAPRTLTFVLGNTLFQSFTTTLSEVLPSEINAIRIPDVVGDAPKVSLSMSTPRYAFTNIAFENASVNNDTTVVQLGDGVINFTIDLNVTVVADYHLKSNVMFYKKKTYQGKASVNIQHAYVRGTLTVERTKKGKISLSVDRYEAGIADLVPSMPNHPEWVEWFSKLLEQTGRPVFSMALSSTISTFLPSIIENALTNTAIPSFPMVDGREVETSMDVVGEPVIAPNGMLIELDFQTAVRR